MPELRPVDLADWPLPGNDDVHSKHDRGTVLVIGGSTQTPGSVLLAGLAALRAGAGRLQIATTVETASALATLAPESRVIGVPTSGEEIDADALSPFVGVIEAAD